MSNFLFIIDTRLSDYQNIIDSLSSTDTYYLIDSSSDGLTQMASILSGYSDLDALHIFSHGSIGSLNLGNTIINQENITSYQSQLQTIGNALSANGNILLYGCNVAQGDAGQSFIDTIADYTGADVAASDDVTGISGDWNLEVQSGTVESQSLAASQYPNVMGLSFWQAMQNEFANMVDTVGDTLTVGASLVTGSAGVASAIGSTTAKGFVDLGIFVLSLDDSYRADDPSLGAFMNSKLQSDLQSISDFLSTSSEYSKLLALNSGMTIGLVAAGAEKRELVDRWIWDYAEMKEKMPAAALVADVGVEVDSFVLGMGKIVTEKALKEVIPTLKDSAYDTANFLKAFGQELTNNPLFIQKYAQALYNQVKNFTMINRLEHVTIQAADEITDIAKIGLSDNIVSSIKNILNDITIMHDGQKLDLVAYFRTPNPSSLSKIEAGFIMKGMDIKNKTMDAADYVLNPAFRDAKGKIGITINEFQEKFAGFVGSYKPTATASDDKMAKTYIYLTTGADPTLASADELLAAKAILDERILKRVTEQSEDWAKTAKIKIKDANGQDTNILRYTTDEYGRVIDNAAEAKDINGLKSNLVTGDFDLYDIRGANGEILHVDEMDQVSSALRTNGKITAPDGSQQHIFGDAITVHGGVSEFNGTKLAGKTELKQKLVNDGTEGDIVGVNANGTVNGAQATMKDTGEILKSYVSNAKNAAGLTKIAVNADDWYQDYLGIIGENVSIDNYVTKAWSEQNISIYWSRAGNGIILNQNTTVQIDEKVVVVHDGQYDYVYRYNKDGTLDGTFGIDGKVLLNYDSNNYVHINCVELQENGKIVVGGNYFNEGVILYRLNNDGSLDQSFGNNGKISAKYSDSDQLNGILFQNDGKIVTVGSHNIGPYANGDIVIRRFNADGTEDNTFGTHPYGMNGISIFGFYSSNETVDYATNIVLQDDGKMIVIGSTNPNSLYNLDFVVLRLNADGLLDTTFNNKGYVTTDFLGSLDYGLNAVVQQDGKIIVAGASWNGLTYDYAAVRYNQDGSIDTSFSNDGKVLIDFGGNDYIYSIELDLNGNITLIGNSDGNFALAKITSDGFIDEQLNILPKQAINIFKSSVTESDTDTGQANFTVTLSEAATQDITFNYVVSSDTATAGKDFDNTLGKGIILAGQTSTTISVDVFPDNQFEEDETFTVTLKNIDGANLADSFNGIAIGTILNDDTVITPVAFSLTTTAIERNVDNSQSINVKVRLSSEATETVTLDYATVDKSAISGQDYVATNGTLAIAKGMDYGYINVTVLGDNIFEGDEHFDLVLSNPVNARLINPAKGTFESHVKIIENDLPNSTSAYVVTDYVAGTTTQKIVIGNSVAANVTGNSLNNTIIANDGSNIIYGGDGNDTVSYTNTTAGVTVDLSLTIAQNTIASDIDTLLNIENIIGSYYDDTLSGNTENNSIDGGEGIDTASYTSAMSNYTITKNFDGTVTVSDKTVGRDGMDTLTNIEQIQFLDGLIQTSELVYYPNTAPTITSISTATIAENAPISTLLYTATATDVDAGTTLMYSLLGSDAALLDINSTNGEVTLKTSANYEEKNSYSFNVIASDGALTDTKAVTVSVTNVNEIPTITSISTATIAENAATSTVLYTATATDVDAGATLTYSLSGDDASYLNINSTNGEVSLKASANYEAKNSYNFNVIASDGALSDTKAILVNVTNTNDAPSGNVTINGMLSVGKILTVSNTLSDQDGLGAVHYQWYANDVAVNGATSSSWTLSSDEIGKSISVLASYTDNKGTEEIFWSSKTALISDVLPISGTDLADKLTGTNDDDVFNGGQGADTMSGGLGDDTYYVDNSKDKVTETSKLIDEIDTVISSIDYTLGNYVENLTLIDTALKATGNTLSNTLTGNGLNNILDGKSGGDTMIGGEGNDTYYVDNLLDTITEEEDEGEDTVISAINYTLGNHLENLTLSSNAISATGNELDNTLIGNSLANTLNGGLGDDLIDGGKGKDTMIGGEGDDTYIVDSSGDLITELSNEGEDSVSSKISYTLASHVENLTLLGTASLKAYGNELDNTLEGNIGKNTLDGGAGADTLIGGLGKDTYYVDNAEDSVIEEVNLGEIDTLYTSISYTLSDNVENLILTGVNDTNGTGNDLANTLTGNTGANILDGGAGGDKLYGGAGNDTYYIDNLLDTISEKSSSLLEIDTVYSSINYTLGKNVENLTLDGDAISATGNTRQNILIGNDENNTLNAKEGNDTLTGGLGNDTFIFNTKLSATTNVDTITDFVSGEDTIALENGIFKKLTTATFDPISQTLLSDYFVSNETGTASEANDYILYNTSTGALYYDADGNAKGIAIQIAILGTSEHPHVSAGDFAVI